MSNNIALWVLDGKLFQIPLELEARDKGLEELFENMLRFSKNKMDQPWGK